MFPHTGGCVRNIVYWCLPNRFDTLTTTLRPNYYDEATTKDHPARDNAAYCGALRYSIIIGVRTVANLSIA